MSEFVKQFFPYIRLEELALQSESVWITSTNWASEGSSRSKMSAPLNIGPAGSRPKRKSNKTTVTQQKSCCEKGQNLGLADGDSRELSTSLCDVFV